jgi:hypothetical protein
LLLFLHSIQFFNLISQPSIDFSLFSEILCNLFNLFFIHKHNVFEFGWCFFKHSNWLVKLLGNALAFVNFFLTWKQAAIVSKLWSLSISNFLLFNDIHHFFSFKTLCSVLTVVRLYNIANFLIMFLNESL